MIKVEIIKGDKISKKLMGLINNSRVKEWGAVDVTKFSKKVYMKTLFFIVKEEGKVVSFGMLMPVNIRYEGKTYHIKGIGGIISIKKGKGYGKMLVSSMVDYLKNTKQTGIGFCGQSVTPFYKKAGMKVKKGFIGKFFYIDPKTKKEILDEDPDCDGVYIEGKDKFVSIISKNTSRVQISVHHW